MKPWWLRVTDDPSFNFRLCSRRFFYFLTKKWYEIISNGIKRKEEEKDAD